ncbi:MAG: hypothetical protein PHW75_00875 [Patescibacteria group bacterium]|nr:hypothetical protein [Patescibacteria group bacterium]
MDVDKDKVYKNWTPEEIRQFVKTDPGIREYIDERVRQELAERFNLPRELSGLDRIGTDSTHE